MSTHAKLSPSGAKRWMNCPGSVRLTADLPDQDSVYSREGTFLHDVAASILDGTGVDVGYTDGEFTLTEELLKDVITPYVEYVKGVRLTNPGQMLVEARVVLSNRVYGTADCIIGGDEHIDVLDLKCGGGEYVAVEDNPQLLIYAAGALALMQKANANIKTVTIHVVQPRRSNIDMVTYTVDELAQFVEQVQAAAAATDAPDAPLVSGSWCRFCKAESTCPRLYEDGIGSLKQVFPTGDARVIAAPPGPDQLTDDELAKVITAAKAVRNWLDAAEEEAYRRVMGGRGLPGFKLVERLSNRQWRDEATAAGTLEMIGVDPYVRKLVSPAQAEKLIKGGKKIIDPLTTRTVTGCSLVPVTDKRPAVLPGTVVFTPLTDGE